MTFLDKSIRAGSLELKNRLVMAPVATEKSNAGAVTHGEGNDRFSMVHRGKHPFR